MPSSPIASAKPTFLQSNRTLARAMRPVQRFLHVEAAGGIVLVVATVAALIWANSPWGDNYHTVWNTHVRLEIGSYVFDESLRHVVNDLLMSIFFFVVGMEIKRELIVGELRDRRSVALPAMAALGGMLVPAAIYFGFNAGTDGTAGWGIPMATDIAFALGVVALLGSRVPAAVKVLLLTLAIVDDIGAILVIAVFYTDQVQLTFLIAAAIITCIVLIMHRAHIVYMPLIALMGGALWICVFESGVHATIAGVIMGVLMPARPLQSELEADEVVGMLNRSTPVRAREIRVAASLIRGSVAACDRMTEVIHPWSSYLIIPIFALANAGISLSADAITSPSSVLSGVAVALVFGKFIGVTVFSWIAVRFGLGRLPAGVTWTHILGVGSVAGIGFTVSLFITDLAFTKPALQDDSKIGILIASIVAALVGVVVLARAGSASPPPPVVDLSSEE